VQAALSDTQYHLALWDRQEPILDDQISAKNAEWVTMTGSAVEANALAWSWAITHPVANPVTVGISADAKDKVCWAAYTNLSGLLANNLYLYGADLQVAFKSASSEDWNKANADLSRFRSYRAEVDGIEGASMACESGAPAPLKVPILGAPGGVRRWG
jgi:hypothetical protein